MATNYKLSDLLPDNICRQFASLIEHSCKDTEYFDEHYESLVEDRFPLDIRCGKIHKVRSRKNIDQILAIKELKIDQQAVLDYRYDLFTLACQEAVICKELGLTHESLIKSHPDLNWIVLPEIDAERVVEVLEDGANVPLNRLHSFLGTTFFMVFEWYPDDLGDVLGRGDADTTTRTLALPTKPVAIEIMQRIMLGLVYLHGCGYIHNDLKANNILLRFYGHEFMQLQIVIADFGFSQCQEFCQTRQTKRKQRHRFDAPDRQYSFAVDMWPFGLMMFELLYVIKYQRRLTPYELSELPSLAKESRSKLRHRISEILYPADGFFVEAIVQCLHVVPEYRPSARFMYQFLLQSQQYKDGRDAARDFHKLCARDSAHVMHEFLFPYWYKHVFLDKLLKSRNLARRIIYQLTNLATRYDFPLAAVFQHFDVEMLDTLAVELER